MKKSDLIIRICTICDNRCSYCALGEIKYNKYFDSNKLKILNEYNLNNFDSIHIQGGEPGLVSKYDLDLIFNYLKNENVNDNRIIIFTDGLFLDKYKNYYKNYIYVYHVIDFDSFIDYSKYNLKLYNIYVIHDLDSIEIFEKLLKSYPNLFFDMIFDCRSNFKSVSDEFFIKVKRLIDIYDNITIDKVNKFDNKLTDIKFSNKKMFTISNIMLKSNNSITVELY
jgi:hypothetical protein